MERIESGPATLRPRPDAAGWDVETAGRVVGAVMVRPVATAVADVEVTVDAAERDRGIGTEALRAAARWLLTSGDVRRLEHRSPFGAWASRRVAEKAGFGYEGLLRGAGSDGSDVWLCARLAGDDEAERAVLLPQPWLHGGAVSLRPFEPGDGPDVAAACNDPLTLQWITGMPSPYTEADGIHWATRRSHEIRAAGTGVDYAIVENTSGRLTGGVGLHHLERLRREVEIGYWVAPWARGRGYAAEAARVLSRWALATLPVHRVCLYAAVGNEASARVAEKAGFSFEGVARSASAARDGSPVDLRQFAMIR